MGFSIQTHNIYWEAVEHLMVNAWALETNWIWIQLAFLSLSSSVKYRCYEDDIIYVHNS